MSNISLKTHAQHNLSMARRRGRVILKELHTQIKRAMHWKLENETPADKNKNNNNNKNRDEMQYHSSHVTLQTYISSPFFLNEFNHNDNDNKK